MFIKAIVFKIMFKKVNYNKQGSLFSGVKSFRAIFNNRPVTDVVKNLNGSKKEVFWFLNSLHSISHYKIIKVLNEHIDFCFKGGMGNLLYIIGMELRRVTKKDNVIIN